MPAMKPATLRPLRVVASQNMGDRLEHGEALIHHDYLRWATILGENIRSATRARRAALSLHPSRKPQ